MAICIVTTVGAISARFHQECEDLAEGSYREQKRLRIGIMDAASMEKSGLINRLYRQQTTPTQPRISYGIPNMQIQVEIGTPWLMPPCECDVTCQRQNDSSPYQRADLIQAIPMQVRSEEEYQSIEAEISAIEKLGCQATPEQRQIARELSLLIQQYEDNWISQSSIAMLKADELLFWKRFKYDEEFLALLHPQSPNGRLLFAFIARNLRAFHLQSFYNEAYILNESYIRGAILLHDGEEISSLPAWLKTTCHNIIRELQRDQQLDDYLLEIQFSDVDIGGASFINANLNTVRLRSIRLRRAKLSGAQFKEAKLDGTNLCGTDCSLVDCPGVGVNFNRVDLDTTGNMEGTRFECDLGIDEAMRANLHDRDAQEEGIANLYGAILSKINTDENEMNQPNLQAGIPAWDSFCKDFAELLNPNHPSAVSLAFYIRRTLRQFKLSSITEFDVLTEVFLRAYKLVILGGGVVIRYPAAWVRRTAFNYIRELSRDHKLSTSPEIDIGGEAVSSPVDYLILQVDIAILQRVLQELDSDEQRLLTLKVIDELSWTEIRILLAGEGQTFSEDALRKQKERALKQKERALSIVHPACYAIEEPFQLISIEPPIFSRVVEFCEKQREEHDLRSFFALKDFHKWLTILCSLLKTLPFTCKSTSEQIQVEIGLRGWMPPCECDVTYQRQNDSSPYQRADLIQAIPMQVRSEEEYQSIEAEISAIEKLGCQATPEQRQIARELSLLIQQYEERMVKNWLESCKFEMN